ncbi:hypothetical protein SFHH103_02117 [Sinorhizobium fredii HH103]|uniref:Uncharacterized protein n=1 Tax=Sinorhizobium fredii (strain HH103) TaxID=1117943 RepID=G9A8N2_SINF1|nr:hypothetical protein SFHH103_02117 [Sinorhizobium fredii HH103]
MYRASVPTLGGGGLLGGLFGALFGLKDGGFVSKDMSPLRLARGGHVSGPGGPRDDKVPAYLSDGEFVVNADATRKNRAALEAINRGGVPRLADGKAVGRSLSAGGSGGGGSVTFAPTTQITVQGAGGSAEDQKALGDQLAAKVNDAMDAKMNEFMAKQMRSGGSLNRYVLADIGLRLMRP